MRLLVTEVHNFGGFFGGDTVTLSGVAWPAASGEQTLTIDAAALANVADRHTVAAGMLFELAFAGERVERAVLLAARSHHELRHALGEPVLPTTVVAPLVLAARCERCELWVLPADLYCSLCAASLPVVDSGPP